MSKVFCIGMFRTGTTSLGQALEILNYNTLHGPWWPDEMIRDPFYKKPLDWPNYYPIVQRLTQEYDAFQDYPWMYLFRECYAWFPDAKFILTIRDPETVVASTINQFKVIKPLYCLPPSKKIIRQRYTSHLYQVIDFFRDKDNLLIINLESGDGWNELCSFLDYDVPNVEFPHCNRVHYPGWVRKVIRNLLATCS